MTHQLRFEYLICSYLPGLPFSLAVYALVLGKSLGSGDYWTFYIVIVPLIVGLFVDGVRHLLALLLKDWWQAKSKNKKAKSLPLFWQDLTEANIDKASNYNDIILSDIMSKHTIFYHVFEFFFNFALSSLFALVIILCHIEQIQEKDRVLVLSATLILVFISFAFSQVFLYQKDEFVDNFLGNSEEKVNSGQS